jgi:hypothetical protein
MSIGEKIAVLLFPALIAATAGTAGWACAEDAVGYGTLRDPLATHLSRGESPPPAVALLAELFDGERAAALYWPWALKDDGAVDDDVFAILFVRQAGAWTADTKPLKVSGRHREAFLASIPLAGASVRQRPAPPAEQLGAYIQARLDSAAGATPEEAARLAEELAAAFTLETGTLSDRVIEALLEAREADALTWRIAVEEDGATATFHIERRHGNFVGRESGRLSLVAADPGVRIGTPTLEQLSRERVSEAPEASAEDAGSETSGSQD